MNIASANMIAKKIAVKLPLRHNVSVSERYAYFQNNDQYVVIGIVVDKYSTFESPIFSINCGVQSIEILRFRGERVPGDFSWRIQVAEEEGQGESEGEQESMDIADQAIQSLTIGGWKKSGHESLDDVIDRVVRKLTDDVIPQLLVIDDDWLINLWSTGSMQGIGELQRLEFLTILLRHKERWEECERVCQEMIEFRRKVPRVRWIHGHVRKVLSQ